MSDVTALCDTCWVSREGRLERACTLRVEDGLRIGTCSEEALRARRVGMDRALAIRAATTAYDDDRWDSAKPAHHDLG